MSFPGRKPKIATISLILASLIALGAAGNIQTAGDDTVWKDSRIDPQLEAQCTAENSTVSAFNASSGFEFDFESGVSRVEVSSADIPSNSNLWGSKPELNLVCERNGSKVDTVHKDITFAELSFSPAPDNSGPDYGQGEGFVGEVMKDEKGSLGNREAVELSFSATQTGEISNRLKESLEDSSFDFGDTGPLVNSEEAHDVQDGSVKLYPEVLGYLGPGESFQVEFEGKGILEGLRRSVPADSFDPFVHVWSSDVVNDPGRRMGFDKVRKGGYVYDLFMSYAPNDNFPESEIDDDNFVLTVREKGDEWDSGYQEVEDGKYEDMPILETSRPDSSNANYRVKIPEVGNTPLEDLPDDESPYKFVLKFRYQTEKGPRYFAVDEMLVDKSENPSRFSGQVLDSGGNGVRADMLLKPVSTDDSYLVSSGSNGQFSKDLSTDLSSEFDMELDFFDSGNRVTELTLSGVNLEDANLGSQDISAVNFDYWSDPQSVSGLNVEGLKPVNMMAVRFGYDIDSVESVSMDFDSSQLDPQNLKVYECDAWNFWGTRCESQWEKVADNQNQSVVEYPQMWASFDNIDLYETSGNERILRNAYVVGRSAELQLQRSISLESTQVKHNGKLKASGVLVDENGNRVDDAELELSLVDPEDEEVVDEWDTTTDATGSFSFDGKVEAEAGNYLLELEASKNPYQPLEMESDETVSVYYERGLNLDVPASPEIDQGETSEISFDVSNTGQRPIEDIEISVEGVRNSYYSVSNRFSSLESGSETVTINLELPGDYCSYPCSSSPEFNVEVTGESGGESVSSSALIPTTLTVERPSQDEEQSQSEDHGSEQQNETSQSQADNSSGTFSQVNRMTGDFVQKQGELNIALALIMIFTMVLAAAVKKRKDEGGDRRGRGRGGRSAGARPNVSRPDVNSSESDEVPESEGDSAQDSEGEGDEAEEVEIPRDSGEVAKSSGEEKSVEEVSEEVPENVCDICGEEFEGSTGVKIHKQAVHE
jgi:hypothetical protein